MVLDTLTGADRVELLELYSRSVMLLDLNRCEEWARLFEPQALLQSNGTSDESRIQYFEGHDELLKFGRRIILGECDITGRRVMPPLRCRPLISNVSLFGQGPRSALGHAYLLVTSSGGVDAPRWLFGGMYSDRLRKCAAGWRFESRTFTADCAYAATATVRSVPAPATAT